MITPKNLVCHEMIGLDTKITNSKNSKIIGINGTIIDESKSMFTINTKQGMKKIPKDIAEWEFVISNNKITIDGKTITKRPHERLEIKV